MKKSNIKLNYFYSLTFQLFSLIIPLITTPYISRVLSVDGIGQLSFATTIISYFCLFATLGFSLYGQREISKLQGDSQNQIIIFREIVLCKLLVGVPLFFVCWALVIFRVFDIYSVLVSIMSIDIISSTIDISFFFQGNENFRTLAVRDLIVKILSVVFIFIFVKAQTDLWIYALCKSSATFVSAIVLWLCLKCNTINMSNNFFSLKKHYITSLKLFVPTIAISVFTMLDKTLIGLLIKEDIKVKLSDGTIILKRLADIENGYYSQSEKIVKLVLLVFSSLGTVMLSRNSYDIIHSNKNIYINNIKKTIKYVIFIATPMCFGIIAISNNFYPWFFGKGYAKVSLLLIIFSFMILPSGLGNVLGYQYLIPMGEDLKYALVYIIVAIINLLLNIVLIPRFLSCGAAFASVVAETIAPILMIYYVRKQFEILDVFKDSWKTLLCSCIMCVIVFLTSLLFKPTILYTLILIVEGFALYMFFTTIMGCNIAYELLIRDRSKK